MKAEQLRKSILQMAIQGKLVPQDPSDEPASVLIEKIRAEKQRLIKEGKIKKDKIDSVIFKDVDNRHYEKVGDEVKDITEELPFEIPDSWEWVRLGNAYNVIMGQSPNGNSVDKNNVQGIEFHQGKIYFGEMYLNKSEYKTTLPTKIIRDNAVVLCVRAPVGKVNLVERTICIGRGLCAIIPFTSVPIKFIYFLLQTYEDYFNKNATGTTFKAINSDIVLNQLIPLPPLAEQERIVAAIEKFEPLIAEYDKLEQEESKLNGEIYDKLKKSILQYAIQGKLVPQDETDEPASVLLEKIRAEKKAQLGKKYVDSYIYKGDDNCYYEKVGNNEPVLLENLPFEIPDSWAWARLGNIAFTQTGTTPSTAEKNNFGNFIPFIKPGDILNEKINYYNEGLSQIGIMNGRLISENSILMVCIGGSLGKCALCDRNVSCNQQINTATPVNGIYSKYLFYCLISDYFYKEIKSKATGTATPIIKRSLWEETLVPIPPLNEQYQIVIKIQQIFAEIEKDED